MTQELTYASYLKVEELLTLQQPQSTPAEHDEYLFIIIHQTYELWFRQLIIEFGKIGKDFRSGDLYEAQHTWQRCRTILKTLVGQVDVLETMTPMSFTSFRNRLQAASGFQSIQFREVEYLLGYKRPEMLKYYKPEWPGYDRLQRRLGEPTLLDAFYAFLVKQGFAVPQRLLDRDVSQPNEADDDVQLLLLKAYKSRPDLAQLFELMTDFDEGLQEWRYRHVKLVERTIGNKKGTGGSLGVEFLKRSLFHPVFPDLWAIRHEL
ncbi:MAG: tryptophan 2,3-dioxygenase [Planctomycetota bacterium]